MGAVIRKYCQLKYKACDPSGLSGPGPIKSGHSGLRFFIAGVGRQLGPCTFRVIEVRAATRRSSVMGTLVGYNLYVFSSSDQKCSARDDISTSTAPFLNLRNRVATLMFGSWRHYGAHREKFPAQFLLSHRQPLEQARSGCKAALQWIKWRLVKFVMRRSLKSFALYEHSRNRPLWLFFQYLSTH